MQKINKTKKDKEFEKEFNKLKKFNPEATDNEIIKYIKDSEQIRKDMEKDAYHYDLLIEKEQDNKKIKYLGITKKEYNRLKKEDRNELETRLQNFNDC